VKSITRTGASQDFIAEDTVEALQYGKPKKNDPRKTPAKPSERRKGSKKNKPGSAKKPNNSIQVSKETESRLRKMMTEHNKKVASKGKGSKASMGMLKTAYRRGAGAFSKSHAPNMSRGGWGIARVKAFLYLLRNGRPSNPNYKQDNDLLPKSHPRASVEAAMEDYIFLDKSKAEERSREIGFDGETHTSTTADGETLYFPAKTEEEFLTWYRKNDPDAEEELGDEPMEAAEYQGKKVTLNKPFRTPGKKKKFGVYVQNSAGNVIIVRFGDPNMEIKRDDPKRRKAFRDRHNCAEKKDKTTPGYWSCYQWRSGSKVKGDEEFNKTDDTLVEGMGGCGCNDCGSVEAAEPTPKDDETHDAYMSRCEEMGYSTEECMKAHEGHTFQSEEDFYEEFLSAGMEDYIFSDEEGARKKSQEIGLGDTFHTDTTADGTKLYFPGKDEATFQQWFDKNDSHDASYHSCGMGEKMVGGKCQKVAVTIDIDFSVDETILEASTGRQIVRISGIAFHEGTNKNGWQITRAGADLAVPQMVGADLTLNHPPSESGRFKRNMDGGVTDAVVGIVTEASIVDKIGSNWEVRFKADVYRTELFEALESGLWLRSGYGVSIGGSGIPDEVMEAEDGRTIMSFETDFTFDHLAIVHKPAYERANIETAERVTLEVANDEAFNSHTNNGNDNDEVSIMSDEELTIEASTEEVVESPNYEAEIEALKASLAAREEELNAIKAAEEAKAEELRLSLVEKATEMGIAGMTDLPSETIESVIASFEAARPEVEMKPVVASESVESAPVVTDGPVVANFLNQKRVSTPEEIYEKAYNLWAGAFRKSYNGENMNIPLYAEAKEKDLI